MLDTVISFVDNNILEITIIAALAVVSYYYFSPTPPPPKPLVKPAVKFSSKPSSSKSASSSSSSSTPWKRPTFRKEESFKNNLIRVCYGSQTGTAEEFSRTLFNEAKRYGLESRLQDLELYNNESLPSESIIIFCLATHGEGEPTENAKNFYNWLMDEERPEGFLKGVEYTVFGLGNKTYDHYNLVARKVDARMEELGAVRIFERGEGDDDSSLEEDFISWKKELWPHICSYLRVEVPETLEEEKFVPRFNMQISNSSSYSPSDDPNALFDPVSARKIRASLAYSKPKVKSDGKTPIYDMKSPYMAKVLVNRELHASGSDRSCMHIELEIGDALTYLPGDHLGIYPENDPVVVDQLLQRFNLDGNTVFSLIPLSGGSEPYLGPCTLRQALLDAVDITTPPRKAVLRALAEYTNSPADKARLLRLSSAEGLEEYNNYIKSDLRNIVEILVDFPSIEISIGHLIELLPRLSPRFYSISSSLNANPGRVHITAVWVQYTTPTGRLHNGVATSWLRKMAPGTYIPVFVRSSHFHLPASPSTPIVMVGPGTGLAPFRGFLQELEHKRKTTGNANPAALFFGCRERSKDFIYGEELSIFSEQGVLSHLSLAFSRDQSEKVYVQHRLLENKKLIYDMLTQSNGMFYVCGDANQMAKSVMQAIKTIFIECGGMTEQKANETVDLMQKRNKYLQDVWF